MPSPLHHVVYQSSATAPMTEVELGEILAQSRAWNTAHHLTGILLYSNGDIMQVLEGPEDEVSYIFDRIQRDNRHFSVVKLSDGSIEGRNFSQWSMGFKAISPDTFRQLAGYQNPQDSSYLSTYSENSNESLHSLLSTFISENEIRL